MSVNDLINTQLSDADFNLAMSKLNEAIAILMRCTTNITKEERKKYGSIHEQKKLFVEKVIEYNEMQPGMSSPDVDWNKFKASWASRKHFEHLENVCKGILEMCSDPRMLHDYFLSKSALVDYDYSKYKATKSTEGSYTTKVESLRQFFPNLNGRKGKKKE